MTNRCGRGGGRSAKSLLGAIFAVGVLLYAAQSEAAIVNPEYVLSVPIDVGWVGVGGTVGQNGHGNWILAVTPDGRDAQVTSMAIEFNFNPGAVELFTREEGSTDINGWASQGDPVLTSGAGTGSRTHLYGTRYF
jgi:hypothetical protein